MRILRTLKLTCTRTCLCCMDRRKASSKYEVTRKSSHAWDEYSHKKIYTLWTCILFRDIILLSRSPRRTSTAWLHDEAFHSGMAPMAAATFIGIPAFRPSNLPKLTVVGLKGKCRPQTPAVWRRRSGGRLYKTPQRADHRPAPNRHLCTPPRLGPQARCRIT